MRLGGLNREAQHNPSSWERAGKAYLTSFILAVAACDSNHNIFRKGVRRVIRRRVGDRGRELCHCKLSVEKVALARRRSSRDLGRREWVGQWCRGGIGSRFLKGVLNVATMPGLIDKNTDNSQH